MTGARIVSLGAAQPSTAVTGAVVGPRYGRTAEWLEARTGIKEYRRLSGAEDLIGLAAAAGGQAADRAGLDESDIDLIIAATCSTRARQPALGPQLVERLAPAAASFDLNAACSGFCYALSTADMLIRAGSAQRVLVVAAEKMSALIDPDDVGTGIIFGDGAGAAVVGSGYHDVGAGGGAGDIGPVVWGSDGGQAELISFPVDDYYMRMQGQQVFRWAVQTVPIIAAQACEKADVDLADIEVFVPHQANLRIIDAVVNKLGLVDAVVATDIVTSGNTSSASIPIAMTRLLESGAARSGQLALLVGFGAGLAYAAQVVRLP